MPLDRALILSAGMGTRMGEIGKVLPKVSWPIFSKTLLELQLAYCEGLGINDIYINIHFLADEISAHVESLPKNKQKITLLYENPLLDSGGAIHNLAIQKEVNYEGNVLLVNGDQFLFFDSTYIKKAEEALTLKDVRALLFGIKVNKDENYNETVIENNLLKEIRKNQKLNDYITYSGLGIIKLDGLKPVPGISKFFETVANFRNEKVQMIVPETFEYWDFGTAEVYFKNILALTNAPTSKMKDFLISHSVDFKNYKKFVNLDLKSINLEQTGEFLANTLIYRDIFQKV